MQITPYPISKHPIHMQKILNGLKKFKTDVFPNLEPLFKKLRGEQTPEVLFITCADSRVVPALITQTDPGDMFLVRIAGNIVPPYGEVHGGVTATIEYALMVLKVRHVVVCGHSDCGVVKGMLHPEKLEGVPVVERWLHQAEVARRVVVDNYRGASEEQMVEALTYENVVAQLDHLMTHPSVASALARGELMLHGWVYSIHDGTVMAYDAERGDFVDLVENAGDAPHATPRQRKRKFLEPKK